MCALVQVKWCLGRYRRNPDRNCGAFIKGRMASVPPYSPLWVAQQPWPIYLYQGQGGGKGGQEQGKRRGCMGRSCYTCQGGWLGQATGGFCSKSDRLTSPSPLHETDIELSNPVWVCVRSERRGNVWVYMKVFECIVWSYGSLYMELQVCISACVQYTWCVCADQRVCTHEWWSVHVLTPMCIICVSACQAVRQTGPSDLHLHPPLHPPAQP